MIKKFIFHIWSLRREFVKYFFIGVSAFVIDVSTLYVLKNSFHFSPVWAVVANQPPILLYVFFLNKHWSFKAKGITHRQIIKFFILAGCNYGIAVVWMALLHHSWNLNYMIARVSNIIVAVGWNFLLYKHWVYKDKEQLATNN